MYKEEQDVLEERRNIDECDVDKFGALDSSEKTIDVVVDGGHSPLNRKAIIIAKPIYVLYEDKVMSAHLLEMFLLGVGAVLA